MSAPFSAEPEKDVPRVLRRALFLDRDGVLNVNHGYVFRPEDLEWIPGAREAVLAANQAGWIVVVVTNQSGIARGMYTEADFWALMNRMQADLAEIGARLDHIEFCPHLPGGLPPYDVECECRKPKPGMLLSAAEKLGLDLSRSVLVGDSQSDLEAAAAAGVRSLLFQGPNLLEALNGWSLAL